MRRTDREVVGLTAITDILSRCDVLHLAVNGSGYPYVVPLSFGWKLEGDKVFLYFHGASEGLKHELLAADPRVCVEAEVFHRYLGKGDSATAEYESVIGFGTAKRVYSEEAAEGIRLLMEHCGFYKYDGTACAVKTAVYKIELDSITGKRREVK